jgi:hypothetical protein
MVMDKISTVTSAVAKVLDWIFTIVINAIVTPLSLLYTAITQTFGDKWKLSDLKGVYYFWWSHKDKIIKCSNSLGVTSVITKLSRAPRLMLIVFAVVVIPLVLCAATKLIIDGIGKKGEAKKDPNIIDVEPIEDKK